MVQLFDLNLPMGQMPDDKHWISSETPLDIVVIGMVLAKPPASS
jgi:hypothetical protein